MERLFTSPICNGICFFDLDGTLLNNHTDKVPESALLALKMLKANGYKVVLSTGRDMDTHYSVGYKEIVDPDAIIHMNGSKITVMEDDGTANVSAENICSSQGGLTDEFVLGRTNRVEKLLFKHTISPELLREIYTFCSENGLCMGTSIEGKDYFINPQKKVEADMAYNVYIKRRFAPFEELLKDVEDGKKAVTALSFAGDLTVEKDLVEAHFDNLHLFPFNSLKGADVVEDGFSKAEGMKKICAYYGVPVEKTYAFGDSPNDVALLQAAAVGVAVGNADRIAKDAADFVTDDIDHDGIYNACVKLGLLA